MKCVLVIGNSDGIGLEVTRMLLALGYEAIGISRRSSSIEHNRYHHFVQDVTEPGYRDLLAELLVSYPHLRLCIYCVGVGSPLDLNHLELETRTFQTNLMSAVVTTEVILRHLWSKGEGHFIGLSSIADAMTSAEAPSYSASKAGVSKYWEGLGLALRGTPVKLTNVRFGFVDTKMAKARYKPFLISRREAAEFILEMIAKPRIRGTKPWVMSVVVWFLNLGTRFKLAFS